MTADVPVSSTTRVAIYCNDQRHRGRVRRIQTYVARFNGSGFRYLIEPEYTSADATETWMVGNERLNDTTAAAPLTEWRLHVLLTCKLCGRHGRRVNARHERFAALIGHLMDAGESRISLTTLATILSSE